MRSTLFSIAVHVLAIGIAVVWSGLAPGLLPSPRQMFAFHDFDMVKIADIPLPPARRAPSSSVPAISSGGAPIEPPPMIGVERGGDTSSIGTSSRGNVESVHVLRSVPMLDQAAVDAVKQWKFTPARLNGEVVPVVMTVTVQFKLN